MIAAWVLIAASACGGVEPSLPPAAVVRDSAGVEIVTHEAFDRGRLERWRLADPPLTVIGLEGRGPAHELTEVVGAVRLSDGRIVVGDRQTREARFFDAGGEHVLTVGGAGEGPGEIRRFLYEIDRVRGDTLVLGAWPIGRRHWFTPEGQFVEAPMLGPWYPGKLGRTLVDGSLLLDTYPLGSHGNEVENWVANSDEPFHRPRGVIERVSRDGDVADTLGTFRSTMFFKNGRWPERLAAAALPFSSDTHVAESADRVFIGTSDAPEVRVVDFQGDLARIIRWDDLPVSVTAADREAFVEALWDGLRNPDARRPEFELWLTQIEWPDVKPPFEDLVADLRGALWIRHATTAGEAVDRWTVLGPDGIARANVDVPGGLRIEWVDAQGVLGIRTTDVGLEFVEWYRIERGGSG